jgi:hypothetical protein
VHDRGQLALARRGGGGELAGEFEGNELVGGNFASVESLQPLLLAGL